MIVVVSTENFGDFKGFPVLNAFQETLILDTVCMLVINKFCPGFNFAFQPSLVAPKSLRTLSFAENFE